MLGRGAGDGILEHAFEAGRVLRVELAVEHLSTFGSGYTPVTDEAHGVCRPEKPISAVSHHKQIVSGLSWTNPDKTKFVGEAGAIPDKHVIFGKNSYEPIPAGGSPAAPADSTRIFTAIVPIGADCGLTVPDGASRRTVEPRN